MSQGVILMLHPGSKNHTLRNMAKLLDEEGIKERLAKLASWERPAPGQIQKKFRCEDFVSALAFVNQVGELAEAMDHHPDILIHQYKFVTLTLTTHKAQDAEGRPATGLTRMDFDLAERIENAYISRSSHASER